MKEFVAGQKVIVKNANGYYQLTEGKEYIVEKYEPEHYDPVFTWPAYVFVIGDSGRQVCAHAWRFSATD